VVVYGGTVRRAQGESEIDLITAAQAGDEAASSALLMKYRSFVRCKARSYFLAGADRDDVIQEGMIGLYKAIRDYRPERQASFRSFAELCVTRQLITAIKTATRQKHTPLNTYISLHRPAASEDEGDRVLSDILAAREVCDPAEVVIAAWETASIKEGFTGALRLRDRRPAPLCCRQFLLRDRRRARSALEGRGQRPAARQAQSGDPDPEVPGLLVGLCRLSHRMMRAPA